MVPHQNMRPNFSQRTGQWSPPKAQGNNTLQPDPQHPRRRLTRVFQHDGAQTTELSQLPRGVEHHKTFSVYYCSGMIWAVPYDATATYVGNGKDGNDTERSDSDESDNDNDGEELHEDWAELSFNRISRQNAWSFAGLGQPSQRLLAHHPSQLWSQYFLPDRYTSSNPMPDRNVSGMVGELPLLIALAALSQPWQQWRNLIPRTIVNGGQQGPGWQVSQQQRTLALHGQQCRFSPSIPPRNVLTATGTDQRGVVVRVYKESGEDLDPYEGGIHGRILA